MDRFSTEVHFEHNWSNTPIALDYDIKPLWSTWVTKEVATETEQWFKATYPKTFFTEVKYNGITECRDWSPQQSYAFMNVMLKKFPKDDSYWQNIEALKATNSLYGTYEKIYYIMLTKK
jgi:hypothetical protein